MNPEEIARAFVACPGWEWLECMTAIFDAENGGCRSRIAADRGVAGSADHATEAGALPFLDPQTLAIIAHVLLPKRWHGESVQVEVFPDGTARVMVFKPLLPGVWGVGVAVFRAPRGPVAVSLLRALEEAP